MILSGLKNYTNFGLLVLRIGLGAMMIYHGYPKLLGGPDKWTSLGGAVSSVGINFYPIVWGFLAAAAETIGGALFLIGFAFRLSTVLLFFTMLVASIMHIKEGHGVGEASHAIELAFVFFGLLFVGPGKFSVDKK